MVRRWGALSWWGLSSLALAGALAALASAARVPAVHTFKPSGLGVSFTLPSDWGADTPDPGARYKVIAPGHVAELQISTARTTLALTDMAKTIVAFERQRVGKIDPKGKVTSRMTVVGPLQAVELTSRYRGVSANFEQDEITDFVYAFERNGLAYIFDYSTSDNWLAKEKPIFAKSIKSLQLTFVA